jgi:hypothetical protein
LNGPASLQGRPGQCPECGSKFRIPTYDDVSEEEELEQDINSGGVYDEEEEGADTGDQETPEEESSTEEEGGDEPEDFSLDLTGDSEEEAEQPAEEEPAEERATPAAAAPQPWDSLLAALWPHKSANVAIEIILTDGHKIVADRYSPTLARQGCGLFAVKDDHGEHTIHAVAWSSVSRIVVQGLKRLPDDLFD